MSLDLTVCLTPADTLNYPEGGGHLWVFLNWALGLKALGCRPIWLERFPMKLAPAKALANVLALKQNLEFAGMGDSLALYSDSHDKLPVELKGLCLDLDTASKADLLLDLQYTLPAEIVGRFSRSALVDIDPGLLQIWMTDRKFMTAAHDVYFSIGETVGAAGSNIPDCGVRWNYTPPPVSLEHWPPAKTTDGGRYTTVAHWYYGEMNRQGETFNNDKRVSFMEYLSLPQTVDAPLELALCLGDSDDPADPERLLWEENGWYVRHSWDVTGGPFDYQRYIQESRGEFSCAKPSCMRLQNAWVSDRTLCYLASGKPAIVQYTGASRILPEAAGLFRFRTLAEAAAAIERVEADYENQCRLARALAEEHFDARKVVTAVLKKAFA